MSDHDDTITRDTRTPAVPGNRTLVQAPGCRGTGCLRPAAEPRLPVNDRSSRNIFCPTKPIEQNDVCAGRSWVNFATPGIRTFTQLIGVTMKIRSLVAAIAVSAFALPALAKDIVQTAQDNGSFNTLVVALKEASLVETLKGKGPFTVFAPTDAAFAKIPKDQLDALLKDKAKLTKVLTYHVVPGMVLAKDVKPGMVKTVEGQSITIKAEGGKVMADNAVVTMTDVKADNGVIHVIDTVIMPKS
jgi:hypothetical protein